MYNSQNSEQQGGSSVNKKTNRSGSYGTFPQPYYSNLQKRPDLGSIVPVISPDMIGGPWYIEPSLSNSKSSGYGTFGSSVSSRSSLEDSNENSALLNNPFARNAQSVFDEIARCISTIPDSPYFSYAESAFNGISAFCGGMSAVTGPLWTAVQILAMAGVNAGAPVGLAVQFAFGFLGLLMQIAQFESVSSKGIPKDYAAGIAANELSEDQKSIDNFEDKGLWLRYKYLWEANPACFIMGTVTSLAVNLISMNTALMIAGWIGLTGGGAMVFAAVMLFLGFIRSIPMMAGACANITKRFEEYVELIQNTNKNSGGKSFVLCMILAGCVLSAFVATQGYTGAFASSVIAVAELLHKGVGQNVIVNIAGYGLGTLATIPIPLLFAGGVFNFIVGFNPKEEKKEVELDRWTALRALFAILLGFPGASSGPGAAAATFEDPNSSLRHLFFNWWAKEGIHSTSFNSGLGYAAYLISAPTTAVTNMYFMFEFLGKITGLIGDLYNRATQNSAANST